MKSAGWEGYTFSKKGSARAREQVKEAIACLKLSRHNLAQGCLLDFGCGSAYLLRYLEKKGINVVGLEINPPARRHYQGQIGI